MKNLSRLTALLLALVMLLSITASATEISNYTKADYDADVVAATEQTDVDTLTLIAALKEEAESLDPTASDLQLMCTDIYNRLMAVYSPAADAYFAGDITEEEYNDIYNATGEVMGILYSYGFDPNVAVVVPEGTSATIRINGQSITVYFVDADGNRLTASYNNNYSTTSNSATLETIANTYTVDGYAYSYGRVNNNYIATQIRYRNGYWSYRTSSNSNWQYVRGTPSIYLVYVSTGPTPTPSPTPVPTATPEPGKVKVYVYVGTNAGTDANGNTISWADNPEFLELLGIGENTVDANNFFPVGEIYIDESYLNSKSNSNTVGAALINSAADWVALRAALSDMDTSTLTGTYAVNQGNKVPDYLDQVEEDVNAGIGSQRTALFRWNNTTSYGFADQSVNYHLDLRFSTKKITFYTGNNGITANISQAAKDGALVDTRVYITGSPIQEPRNLDIPDGYQFMGYYEDANFTIPWNGIGTPLNEDEVVYIKITEETNVVVHYEPVPAAGGSVSLDNEALNPDTGYNRTGKAQGSTPTAAVGYTFDGWYLDEACTQPVNSSWVDASTNKLTPQKGSSGKFEAATYYAKFIENTATINYVPVGPNGKNDGSGTVTPTSETLGITTGFATGSTATPNTNYKFVGWYNNEACTGTALSTDSTYVPTKPETGWVDGTTYYAKFEYNLTTLTITKKGMENIDAGQSFLFEVTNTGGVDMVIAINGNGSETISGLTVGDVVTVTEIEAWSWRYSADPETITLQPSGNSVTIDNDRDEIYWLDGDCYAENVFSGKQ